MPKIKKLSQHEINKIAAGEVVERPANIVKELVENSIDAQASSITIYIKQAGKKLIQIIDNGYGMSPEDAQLCFIQHTTSKINSIEDLNSLNTFGFRGEALSSINAISNVELTTKEESSSEGFKVTFENGNLIKTENIACSTGTEIVIKDIFNNVPARLKFLKKDESEFKHIVQIFQAFCLSNINIHFKLFHDDKMVYNCPKAKDLNSRIAQIWDHNLAQNMVNIQAYDETIELQASGAISNHHFARFNRSQIFFFVNGRWIKNQNLAKALLKGYLNVLPSDKFPAAFIFINIPNSFIDVNVHPRKEEVRFLYPKKVETNISTSVKKSLEQNLSSSLSNNLERIVQTKPYLAATPTTFDFEQMPFFEPVENIGHTVITSPSTEQFNEQNYNSQTRFVNYSAQDNIQTTDENKSIAFASQEIPNFNQELNYGKEFEIIGQFNECYILLEQQDGLFVVDQHAAHERVLYELFSNRFEQIARIKLIFPIIVKVNESSIKTLSSYFELLNKYGIEAEVFANDQIVIHSIPVHLKDVSLENIFNELIIWVEEGQGLEQEEFFKLINNKLCAQMACKAAVKSGDKLNIEQMTQLLKDLQVTPNRFTCPHGRPTGWLLSMHEIEKKFKRKL